MGSLSVSTNALASPLATHRNKEKPADLNVHNVVLGDILFKTWYPSFYPEELIGRELERLFVCQWCFKYSKDIMPYLAHTVRVLRLEIGRSLPALILENARKDVRLNMKVPLGDRSTRKTCTLFTRWTARNTRLVPSNFSRPFNLALTESS